MATRMFKQKMMGQSREWHKKKQFDGKAILEAEQRRRPVVVISKNSANGKPKEPSKNLPQKLLLL